MNDYDEAWLASLGMSDDGIQFDSLDEYIEYLDTEFLRCHPAREAAIDYLIDVIDNSSYIAGARSTVGRQGGHFRPAIDYGLIFDYPPDYADRTVIAKEVNLNGRYDTKPMARLLDPPDAPWEHIEIAAETTHPRQAFRLLSHGVSEEWLNALPEGAIYYFGSYLHQFYEAGIEAHVFESENFPTYAIECDGDRILRLYRGGVPGSILGACYESRLPEDDIIEAATTLPPEYAVTIVSG